MVRKKPKIHAELPRAGGLNHSHPIVQNIYAVTLGGAYSALERHIAALEANSIFDATGIDFKVRHHLDIPARHGLQHSTRDCCRSRTAYSFAEG